MSSAYLSQFPSEAFTLRNLSDNLPNFIRQIHDWNLDLLQEVVDLEYFYIQAFDNKHYALLSEQKVQSELLESTILGSGVAVQSHCFFFEEHWNLVALHQSLDDYEEDEELDIIEQHKYWAIYRSKSGIVTELITYEQYLILSDLKSGSSLAQACDKIQEL